ncbi:hypothetical protein AB3Y40_07075 [Yoonia sp. R2331]|uniref:hypothetical protein n=1 Tax=Yoonia sp. R2331 TaxID=3237238 RepID=UPI0034E47923
MFKFLFGQKGTVEAVKETQRQSATRALEELNAVLAGLSDQPRITIAPGETTITIEWPDQMPDEAKALPAPTPEEQTEAPEAPETDAKAA